MHSSRLARSVAALMAAGLLATPVLAQSTDPKLAPYAHIPNAEKVSIGLLDAATTAQGAGKSLGDAFAPRSAVRSGDGVLLELVTSEVTDGLLKDIAGTGVTIRHSSARFNRVTVSANDPASVEKLALIEGVQMIRPSSPSITRSSGAAASQADVAHRSDLVSSKYNVNGSGVRVGIISDSFASENADNDIVTDDFSTAGSRATLISGQNGDISSLPPGEYTLVVQTPNDTDVRLTWSSSVELLTSEQNFPIEEFNCRNRIPLSGFGNSGEFNTRTLTGFAGSSCAGGAANFVLFAFRIQQQGGQYQFEATAADGAEIFVSLRTECDNLASEIACVEGDPLQGVSGLTNQISGDLPAFVTVLADAPGTNEGAAMAELVHDIAPGADIGFHTGDGGQAVFAEGILRLADVKFDPEDEPFRANVIVDDLLYFAEPMYQKGIIAQAVEEVVNRGVTYLSAAGNGANYGFKVRYQDVSGGDELQFPPRGGDLMRWPQTGNGYLPIRMSPGSTIDAVVQWNQPWQSLGGSAGSQIDFDAYVLFEANSNGFFDALTNNIEQTRFSIDKQGDTGLPTGDPYERVIYTNNTGAFQTVYLAIDHFRGAKGNIPQGPAPVEVRVVFFGTDGLFIEGIDEKNPHTGGPTIYGHAQNPSAIAVGAVNWFDSPAFDTSYGPTNAIDAESFSAQGGELTIYFDGDGSMLSLPLTVNKPDVSAVNGNNTTFFPGFENGNPNRPIGDFDLDGFPNFFGTSAAAPNAAAVVALLLQMNRNLSPGQIANALRETAIDVVGERASVGVDNVTGYGLVDALAAADYVAANFGVQIGSNAPKSRLFTFDFGGQGWVAESVSGFASPNFVTGPNALSATNPNTVNTLGWFKSPSFIASGANVTFDDGSLPINGLSGRQGLFRASFKVTSNAARRADVPTFRLRQSSATFERSDVLVVTSTGDATLAPLSPLATNYRHYFSLPPAGSKFNLYFDVLGFDPNDAANVTLNVDEVVLEGFATDSSPLTGGRLETLQFFANNRTNNWTARSAAPLRNVRSSSDSRGIVLGPATAPGEVGFGFWGSPENNSSVVLEKNRLYRASFSVNADIPANAKIALPTFRVRMNDSSNQMSAYVDVNAVSPAATVPANGEAVIYDLYFEAPEALDGHTANFAIDYLYIPGLGKDPNRTVVLESLRVDSFLRPVAP